MIKFDETIGKNILSTKEGEVLGNVSKVVLNNKTWKVIGFVVETADGGQKYLLIETIDQFGKDVFVVHSKEKMKDLTSEDMVAFGEELIGARVLTGEGKELGQLSSFHFDKKTGEITHYEMSEGPAKDLLEGKSVFSSDGAISISTDKVVVKQVVDEITDTMKAEPGLKHKAVKVKAEAKKKAEELGKKIRGKLDSSEKKE